MVKQFLLNPDGTVPEWADVASLEVAGVLLVMPTPVPRAQGMVAVERDPQQDADGVWRQVWMLEPAPEPVVIETPADPLASLTAEQKAALLALLQGATK